MTAPFPRILRVVLVVGMGLGCALSACESAVEISGGAVPPLDASPGADGEADASSDVEDAGAFAEIHLLAAAEYPTTVAHGLPPAVPCALWYAGADGAFVASFAAWGQCDRRAPPSFQRFTDVPSGQRPWRINVDDPNPSLAGGGSAFTLEVGTSGMLAKPAGVLADAVAGAARVIDPVGDAPARLWAVATGPKAGVHRSYIESEAATGLLTFGLDNPPNATALFVRPAFTTFLSNDIIVGDLGGNARLCITQPYHCQAARSLGKTRIDAIIAKPNDPFGKYALLADAVVSASTESLFTEPTSSLATDTAGFDGPGGYYARAIAAGPHCAYFSSKRGLEWARDVDGVLQGGIVVPRAQLKAEVLGVAVGPVPSKGEADPDASDAEPVDGGTLQAKSVVFFTSYAPKSDGGGVYFVDEPAQCTNGNFSVSGKIVDITRRVPVEVVLNDTYSVIVKWDGGPSTFTFPNKLSNGSNYTVTVRGNVECRVVSGGTGRIKGAHVIDVVISCLNPG